jgi:hypothetical protein
VIMTAPLPCATFWGQAIRPAEPVQQTYGIDVPGRGSKMMNIGSCGSTAANHRALHHFDSIPAVEQRDQSARCQPGGRHSRSYNGPM